MKIPTDEQLDTVIRNMMTPPFNAPSVSEHARTVLRAFFCDSHQQDDMRYEYVRRLNPRQFQELYARNLRGEGGFDQLVDAAILSP